MTSPLTFRHRAGVRFCIRRLLNLPQPCVFVKSCWTYSLRRAFRRTLIPSYGVSLPSSINRESLERSVSLPDHLCRFAVRALQGYCLAVFRSMVYRRMSASPGGSRTLRLGIRGGFSTPYTLRGSTRSFRQRAGCHFLRLHHRSSTGAKENLPFIHSCAFSKAYPVAGSP